MLTAIGATALNCAKDPEQTRVTSQRLIDGDLAPAQSGTVWLTHPAQALLCSGAVVHPRLVVTTKHCVFSSRPEGDTPLSASGFRVGFGPNQESQEFRTVAAMDWVGAPLSTSVESAVTAGQDVALLELSLPVPKGIHIYGIGWDYTAQAQQQFLMVGFGLSSLTLGTAGVRRSAPGVITGFSPETGILQLEGKSACFGDSGGPILFGNSQQWVGTISQIGGSSADQFCDIGLTFGATLLNPEVRALLQRGLAKLETCPAEVCGNQQDEDCDGAADNGCEAPSGGASGNGGALGNGGASASGSTGGTGSNGNQGGSAPGVNLGGTSTAGGTIGVEPSAGARAPVHVGTLAPLLTAEGGSNGGGAAGSAGLMSGTPPQLSARGGCSLGRNSRIRAGFWLLLGFGVVRRWGVNRRRRVGERAI